MNTEHIVKSFDEDLKKLDNTIAEMGGLAEVQLADAIEALIKRDTELADRVIAGDKKIDMLEADMDTHATTTLALRQPMADDLRVTITALRTASLIERIGDYAKNIAKRSVVLSQSPPLGPAKSINRMATLVQGMIKDVLDAYVARDVDKAEAVRARDADADLLHTSLFREILTYMMEDPRTITSCTHLLFVAKNLERIGDHATNIAENVYYLVNGEPPVDEREKSDASSFTVVEHEAE
ncbi:MAG: phosphate transport system regulatory protein PhoU [Rhodospirillaceae bacterium]|nr:phosphate transport system regulatory protein PhoU [Rhodospirillaceae bacterium]